MDKYLTVDPGLYCSECGDALPPLDIGRWTVCEDCARVLDERCAPYGLDDEETTDE